MGLPLIEFPPEEVTVPLRLAGATRMPPAFLPEDTVRGSKLRYRALGFLPDANGLR
jgi:hypothetical protein